MVAGNEDPPGAGSSQHFDLRLEALDLFFVVRVIRRVQASVIDVVAQEDDDDLGILGSLSDIPLELNEDRRLSRRRASVPDQVDDGIDGVVLTHKGAAWRHWGDGSGRDPRGGTGGRNQRDRAGQRQNRDSRPPRPWARHIQNLHPRVRSRRINRFAHS